MVQPFIKWVCLQNIAVDQLNSFEVLFYLVKPGRAAVISRDGTDRIAANPFNLV